MQNNFYIFLNDINGIDNEILDILPYQIFSSFQHI